MDLKLIIEKGPREGETLTYSPNSSSLIKVGRVVKGNTFAIKESGISTKHLCIQFDNQLKQWIVYDLNSSNGTFLNTQKLDPHVPSVLNNGDRIKIGELTSIVVMIEVQSLISAAAVGEDENNELGLGFGGGGDLGKVEPVKKRNLRSSVKKGVEARNEVETASSRRTLRSSKKDEVSLVSALNQIPENLNVDVSETVNVSVPVETKVTRGRKKKIPDLDQTKPADAVVVEPVRTTRGRKKALPVETLEDKLNNVNECLQVGDGNEATLAENLNADVSEMVNVSVPVEPKMTRGRKKKVPEQPPDLDQTKPANVVVVPARTTRGRKKALPVETLEDNLNNVTECLQVGDGNESTLGGNLEPNNEPVEEQLEKMVSTQEGCEGSSKGKKEEMKYGCYNEKWNDLEKMTVDDFFDYLEWQFAKEIYEKSEKIIADMTEKARKYHEFRRQINDSGKGKN